jgi:hypothetical protein
MKLPLHRQRELPNPQKCNTVTELGGCCVYGGRCIEELAPFFLAGFHHLVTPKKSNPMQLIHTKDFCAKINGEVDRF